MAWIPAAINITNLILRILGIIGLGMTLWYGWQWGQAVTTGVQQAAPGVGAAVSAVGMLFAMMPAMLMMFMYMQMFTSLISALAE